MSEELLHQLMLTIRPLMLTYLNEGSQEALKRICGRRGQYKGQYIDDVEGFVYPRRISRFDLNSLYFRVLKELGKEQVSATGRERVANLEEALVAVMRKETGQMIEREREKTRAA